MLDAGDACTERTEQPVISIDRSGSTPMVCEQVNVRAPGSAATQDVVSINGSTPTAR